MLRALNDFCVIGACLVTTANLFSHFKNYRKPMDQRLIVRILLMVPMFSITAWCGLYHPKVAKFLLPIQELYEGFVIYTFFSLLTNLLGGERDIIVSTTGRPPKHMPWPISRIIESVDISDPYTFLWIKRLIMQYVWIRILITILEVLFGEKVWLLNLILYNVSLTLTLNALMLFWVCLAADLRPYRALPKFLSIKAIVFFSYWQSLFLTMLHAVGIIRSRETLNTVSNTLLCVETLFFAFFHWDAFPYTDYATTKLIGFARLPMIYAMRDAFGIRDLVYDFKCTFYLSKYGYREFDSVEAVLDHPQSRTRAARLAAGMRYKNGGRSKYWLPKGYTQSFPDYGSISPALSPVQSQNGSTAEPSPAPENPSNAPEISWDKDDIEGDEPLYAQARKIYGDYNFPIITVRESTGYVTYEERARRARQT